MNVAERFWSLVAVRGENECWEWTRGRISSGYGEFCPPKSACLPATVYAHRFAYELRHGPIADGQQVRHTCDNPPCCNPAHLLLGSNLDNIRDRVARGRYRGAQVPSAKLTEEAVLAIRERYARGGVLLAELALEHGLNKGTVGELVRGETWKHVGGPRSRSFVKACGAG